MNIIEISNTQVTPTEEIVIPDEIIITDTNSFDELMNALSMRPEAIAAAKMELEVKRYEKQKKHTAKLIGCDAPERWENCPAAEVEVPKRRPRIVALRTTYPRIATYQLDDCQIDVFSNGYAQYDNGNRRTIVWIPDCSNVTYYFGQLRENEKQYMTEKSEVGEDVLGGLPWYLPVSITGENRIESNMDRPKSDGTESELDDALEYEEQPAPRWNAGAHFDSPEAAYLRKEAREAREARRKTMTEKQREVYDLHFEEGYSMRKIADMVGVGHSSIQERVAQIVAIFEQDEKYFFI